ncbi:MAG: peptidase domain-containing ABC transporter [Planctomycetes bacterium]|nr:peptidase domain-containing ABC transporter [Planctomycetota bacterium]
MRLVCVRQQDPADCGAAVLATVARHYGRPISVQQLRTLTGTDSRGTNLLGLVEAARKLGFEARGVQAEIEALAEIPLPAIAHLRGPQGNHFVVVHRADRKRVTVADPGAGIEKWDIADFRRLWSGHLVLLVPGEDRREFAGPRGPMRRLFDLLWVHKGTLLEAVGCAILMTLLGLAGSLYVQQLLDSILVHQGRTLLDVVGAGMIVVLLFRVVFGSFRHYLVAHMGRRIDLGLQRRFYGHVLRLPISFFESRRVGDILSRMNETARVREVVGGTTVSLALDGVLVLGGAALMVAYSPALALAALATLPLFALSTFAHLPWMKRTQRRMMEEAADLHARLVEDVTGVETIRACGAEEHRIVRTEAAMVRFTRQVFRNQMVSLSLNGLGLFAGGLASLAVLWVGGHRVLSGELTVGQLMLFSSLIGMMTGPVERLAGVVMNLQDAAIALDRMGEILDLPAESAGGGAAFRGLREGVRLRNVSFRYGCRDFVLRDLDLDVPAGKTVAIVGESGCGKSTLCKLLAGFHAPTEGSILVDGMDARDYDAGSLRRKTGWVQQEPFVFSGTIRENIALGRPDAPFEEIVEAARIAQLAGFVDGLPERYETKIGERGTNLSGGQRQRIAIARAVLRRPDLFIFDEATSHLDTRTETALQEALRGVLEGRTAVLFAHRLSTVRMADVIAVMEHGTIVERGTHEELLALGGRYAELWARQQGAEPWILIDKEAA